MRIFLSNSTRCGPPGDTNNASRSSPRCKIRVLEVRSLLKWQKTKKQEQNWSLCVATLRWELCHEMSSQLQPAFLVYQQPLLGKEAPGLLIDCYSPTSAPAAFNWVVTVRQKPFKEQRAIHGDRQ